MTEPHPEGQNTERPAQDRKKTRVPVWCCRMPVFRMRRSGEPIRNYSEYQFVAAQTWCRADAIRRLLRRHGCQTIDLIQHSDGHWRVNWLPVIKEWMGRR